MGTQKNSKNYETNFFGFLVQNTTHPYQGSDILKLFAFQLFKDKFEFY